MATHPKTSKKNGRQSLSDAPSPFTSVVIRNINQGAWTHAKLANAMKAHMSGDRLKAFLNRLRDLGLIQNRRGGWVVLAKGMDYLPKVGGLPPMAPYTPPPAPPRRPGSSHAHIPSVAAGREYTYRHPI